jgi:hypothetical protein
LGKPVFSVINVLTPTMLYSRLGVAEREGIIMMEKLILGVEARSAEELMKHTAGPGTRYVFSDHNNNPEGNIYTIVRVVENVDSPEQHVEPHSHEYESLAIFKGNKPDFSGLEAEVLAVRIPPGLSHTYRFIRGSGEYWNIVITPGAEYNRTIR